MISFINTLASFMGLANAEAPSLDGANDAASLYGVYITAIISVAIIFIGLYVIKAVAICILAKKRGIKWWWVGMIPYANYVVLGKLAGPIRLFRIDFKNVGYIIAPLLFVCDALSSIYGVYACITVFKCIQSGIMIDNAVLTELLSSIYYVVSELSSVLRFVYYVLFVSLCFALYGKYVPNRKMLYTVLSFFNWLFPIMLITIINKKPYASYDEYLKQKMAERFGQSYDPYSNPYETRKNPFFRGENNSDTQQNEDASDINPFDEY